MASVVFASSHTAEDTFDVLGSNFSVVALLEVAHATVADVSIVQPIVSVQRVMITIILFH